MEIKRGSAWERAEIESFLESSRLPMRLACNTRSGQPLVVSLWYLYTDNHLWCAVHEKAAVHRLLERNRDCGFEIAVNDIPYCGVRGQGRAVLLKEHGADVLAKLVQRYLDADNRKLADWLMSRREDEYAVRIDIDWITAWDYSDRMASDRV